MYSGNPNLILNDKKQFPTYLISHAVHAVRKFAVISTVHTQHTFAINKKKNIDNNVNKWLTAWSFLAFHPWWVLFSINICSAGSVQYEVWKTVVVNC